MNSHFCPELLDFLLRCPAWQGLWQWSIGQRVGVDSLWYGSRDEVRINHVGCWRLHIVGERGERRIAQKSLYSISLFQNFGCIFGISWYFIGFIHQFGFIAGNFLENAFCLSLPMCFFWLAPFPDAPPDPTRHTMRSTLFLRSPCLVVGHQWYDQCCQKWVACWKSRGLCKHQKNSHDNGKPTICICISYSFLFTIFQHCDFPETATLVNHRGRDEQVRHQASLMIS